MNTTVLNLMVSMLVLFQACMSYGDAKALLQDSEDIVKPVYEYWTSKRKKLDDTCICLIPQVRGEKRDGTTTNDPYVAFRRRTEKMQTRKVINKDNVSTH